MKKIFLSGLLNVESSLMVDSFPIEYCPIEYPFFGINSSVSGVGYNIAKALKVLGDDFDLYSIVGEDNRGEVVINQLNKDGIDSTYVVMDDKEATPESIVLVNKEGIRKIYCDLKNIQNVSPFSKPKFDPKEYELAILTNINFNRPLLEYFKKSGVPIATDVHVLSNINDEYNKDFMNNADILFFSNEGCIGREVSFIKEIYNQYHNKIIVIGCGDKGAIAYIGGEDRIVHQEAVAPLGIKNTVGAGDALFTGFIHYYKKSQNIEKSLQFATIFAGIKISSSGGANGFVDEKTVLKYMK